MTTPARARGRWLGPAVLVLCFLASLWHVGRGRVAPPAGDQITIRVGHWLMHAGMREAFAEAARRYEELHPHVRIEQVVVPIRAYRAWLRTQMVGGTAPDITGLLGADAEMLGRHFRPLNDVLAVPNPYHADTPLASLPWRDTFIDGLESIQNLTPATGQIAAVTLQLNTIRLYTNLDLLEAVTGQREPPASFAALQALEDQVAAHAATGGRAIVPIAGCGPYLRYIYDRVLPTQTQQLAPRLSPFGTLTVPDREVALALLDGRLSLQQEEVHATFALMQAINRLLPPGVQQLQRDDALFAFLQGGAVTFIAGSWDYGVLVRDSGFPVGVSRVPVPLPGEEPFGRYSLGPVSEAAIAHEAALGVVRHSAHPEVAIDFLRFLTQPEIATMFSTMSRRVSAVIGVPPPEDAPELAPIMDGAPPGLNLEMPYFGGQHAYRVLSQNLHLLTGPSGGVPLFTRQVERDLPGALRLDLAHFLRNEQREIRLGDALAGLWLTHPCTSSDRLAETWEIQNQREAEAVRIRRRLRDSGR